jgi:hypothetical protein
MVSEDKTEKEKRTKTSKPVVFSSLPMPPPSTPPAPPTDANANGKLVM